MTTPDPGTAATEIIAAAEAVDAAMPAFVAAIDGLQEAEANMRAALSEANMPKRDHLAGGAQLRALALNLAAGGTEVDGEALADIVTEVFGNLVPEPEEEEV